MFNRRITVFFLKENQELSNEVNKFINFFSFIFSVAIGYFEAMKRTSLAG